MKIMVVIPMPSYAALLGRCQIQSREYRMLKNGVVEKREGIEEVRLLCDSSEADMIVDFVTRVAPEHLPSIRQISVPPEGLD